MRSDNGTNLTSTEKELKKSIKEWNLLQIEEYCKQNEIEWIFQPPLASNFGGVFEREIRTIRKVFNSLLHQFENQIKLSDDLLQTLFCEIENIMNCRPLTAVTNDTDYVEAITPNHLLRLKGKEFPPGLFKIEDIYAKRRWRQCQYIADQFWRRYYKEYVPLLMARQKWLFKERSLRPGDVVLVVDNSVPRNHWSLGKVDSVKEDDGNLVRSATVKICRNKLAGENKYSTTLIQRPVNKLILMNAVEE